MSVQVEKLENNMAKLTIEVAAEEFVAATKKAYNKNKNQISVQGFRKGKAPQAIIEKLYGASIFYEDAANDLIPGAYEAAAKESGLDITSYPSIDVVQVEKGKPFIFTAEVALRPDVELGEYKGVEIEKVSAEVTEEDIEAEIKKVQEQNAREVTVDRPAENGDTVMIDYEGSVDGELFEGGSAEGYGLVLGSGSFIPGFEDQLIGASAGADVDVHVTFPEAYHADDLAGKEALFKVKVHEVKTKDYPIVDDEFAQDVSDFDTLEEYKEDLKKNLAEKKVQEAKAEKQQKVMNVVVGNAKMDIPEAMVRKSTDDMMNQYAQELGAQGLSMDVYFKYTGMTPQQLAEQLKPQALANIKNRLVLDAIVAAENIEITDDEIEAEIQRLAESWNMEADKVRSYMDVDLMRNDMSAQKALEMITDAAVEK
ncbi:trigger factor [Frisingicoccus caecimuris]|uniref:Trigger factor n=1 Tax=Frisingicoccus caecimuris TaxID=1796636 RepID=A0A4R2LGB3_9FIRM|nr:trigger factor [Frisingicoccus caecimuris]MCR1919534.1 trigger factor [Frisingicoccus caecimuris]TCO83903.1 trigger factor [Frisingicoccus caecimuris]HAP20391.1 trigger factor [Lachnospiraceae bacterium]